MNWWYWLIAWFVCIPIAEVDRLLLCTRGDGVLTRAVCVENYDTDGDYDVDRTDWLTLGFRCLTGS